MVVRYAQFVDKVILDGRIRPVAYSLDNTVVTTFIPHFWEYAGNFSFFFTSSLNN